MLGPFYATTDFRRLLLMGFSEVEATKLLSMKDHFTDQIEYREVVEEQRRLQFIRWLVQHDRING